MRDQHFGFELYCGILIEFEADCEGYGVLDVGTVEVEVVLAVKDIVMAEYKEGQKDDYLGGFIHKVITKEDICLLYTSPSPRDQRGSRMPSSA